MQLRKWLEAETRIRQAFYVTGETRHTSRDGTRYRNLRYIDVATGQRESQCLMLHDQCCAGHCQTRLDDSCAAGIGKLRLIKSRFQRKRYFIRRFSA